MDLSNGNVSASHQTDDDSALLDSVSATGGFSRYSSFSKNVSASSQAKNDVSTEHRMMSDIYVLMILVLYLAVQREAGNGLGFR